MLDLACLCCQHRLPPSVTEEKSGRYRRNSGWPDYWPYQPNRQSVRGGNQSRSPFDRRHDRLSRCAIAKVLGRFPLQRRSTAAAYASDQQSLALLRVQGARPGAHGPTRLSASCPSDDGTGKETDAKQQRLEGMKSRRLRLETANLSGTDQVRCREDDGRTSVAYHGKSNRQCVFISSWQSREPFR